ncbi:MAG: DUF3737 family protein [Lachnospiraceae bacterium]|nr:DUF3737 family protein [Lachnospiraceae bacterium]
MTKITNQTFDEERALYDSNGIELTNCRFDGPADGESALKESSNILVTDSFFNLRYPFWHDHKISINNCDLTENCRAALWYSVDIAIQDTKLHGIKALRECSNIRIINCDILSQEFGWFSKDINIESTKVMSEYFMMQSNNLNFTDVTLQGKYSFQYITNSVFEDCNFDTKDAFWHAKNTVIRNSVIKGEYLAWYCENLTFENCVIIGTQPFCYCKNLTLINCEMHETDLAFEKSEVNASITTPIISIKNPLRGQIQVPSVNELIVNDPMSTCKIDIS